MNLARGKTHPRAIEYWIWLGGFAVAAIILIMLGRIALRLLKRVQEEAKAAQPNGDSALSLQRATVNVSRGT